MNDMAMTPSQAHALRRATPLTPAIPVVRFTPRPEPSPDGIANATDEQLLAMAVAGGILGLDRWLSDLAADEIESRGLVVPGEDESEARPWL